MSIKHDIKTKLRKIFFLCTLAIIIGGCIFAYFFSGHYNGNPPPPTTCLTLCTPPPFSPPNPLLTGQKSLYYQLFSALWISTTLLLMKLIILTHKCNKMGGGAGEGGGVGICVFVTQMKAERVFSQSIQICVRFANIFSANLSQNIKYVFAEGNRVKGLDCLCVRYNTCLSSDG